MGNLQVPDRVGGADKGMCSFIWQIWREIRSVMSLLDKVQYSLAARMAS